MCIDHRRQMVMLLVLASLALMIVIPNNAIIANNNNVGLALDWHEVQGIAQAAGVSTTGLAQELQPEGIRYLVIREDTLRRLKQVGRIQVLTGWELYQLSKMLQSEGLIAKRVIDTPDFGLQDTYILTGDKELFNRLVQRLSYRLPNKVRPFSGLAAEGSYVLAVQGRWDELTSVAIGISLDDVAQVRALGYEPILSWVDSEKTAAEIDADLNHLAQVRPEVVMPGSIAVGSRERVGAALIATGVFHGVPEFGPAQGADVLAKASGYNTVRVYERPVHTVYQEYLLAVRDRNVRLVIPHLLWQVPPSQGNITLVEANRRHLSQIVTAIKAAGGELGPPQPFKLQYSNRWLLALIIGLLPAVVVWPNHRPLWAWIRLVLGLGLATVTLLLPVGAAVWWRKGVALLVAGAVPAQAIIWAEQAKVKQQQRASLKTGIITLTKCAAYTLLGAIVVQGLLGEAAFLLKLDAFAGIKVAYMITLGLVLVCLYKQQWTGRDWWRQKQIAPVELAALGLLGVAVWVLFNRSGNTSVIPIPAWELSARSFLESILFVRPRTKEFLVGHPALMLAAAGWGSGKSYRPYLIALGAVGQASMMNTFVHLHTPFVISLVRSLLGLGIGLLIGAFLWHARHFIVRRGKEYA
ncbi:MAG: DUF5693 family protein [bacterium]